MGILSRLLQPSETRDATLKNPDQALIEALRGGIGTSAGVFVSEEGALAYGAVLACVRVLSESVAMLPCLLYERVESNGQAGKRRASDHPLYRILHTKPNPEMSAFELWELALVHLLMRGNFYAEIVIDGRGDVSALWPIPPKLVTPRRRPEDRRLVYDVDLPAVDSGWERRTFEAEWIFHVPAMRTTGLTGLGVVGQAREAIGLGLAAQQYGASVFGNGTVPGGVLEHPGELGDKAYTRLQESWAGRHQGLENAQRLAILEEGMTYNKIGIPPEDAQFLETRKFQRSEIAGMFRVPPHLIGDLDRATFSNIEQQSLEYVIYSLGPWVRRIEARANGWLLLPSEQDRYFAEFLVDGLLRGDSVSRNQAYSTARQWGWMSVNEIRQRENLNPVDGGDVYLQPLNMITAGQGPAGRDGPVYFLEAARSETGRSGASTGAADGAGERGFHPPLTPPSEGGGPERTGGGPERRSEEQVAETGRGRQRMAASYRRTFEEVARRLVNREVNDVRNAARKKLKAEGARGRGVHPLSSSLPEGERTGTGGGEGRSVAELDGWLDEFYRDFNLVVREYFMPTAMTLGELTRDDVERETGQRWSDEELQAWIENYVDGQARAWAADHRRELQETLRQAEAAGDDPLPAMEGALDELQSATPERWSREQSVRVINAVAVTIYAAFLLTMRWFAFGESCDYCQQLDGKVVGHSGYFLQSGEELLDAAGAVFRPSGNVRHAPMHTGCDCTVLAG